MADISRMLGDRKKIWGAAFCSLLCVLAFFLLFKYDFGNFRKLKIAIAERKNSLAILDSLGEHKKYLEEFTAFLAPGEGAEWLMETLAAISKSNSVSLSAIKPSGARSSCGYKIITVFAEGVSSYENFLRFVKELEDRKECIFIDKIFLRAAIYGKNPPQDKTVAFSATIASIAPEKR